MQVSAEQHAEADFLDAAKDVCRICGHAKNNKTHKVREMFYGTRDQFTYLECTSCGTLQLKDIPDLSRYYQQDYYSFRPADFQHDMRTGLMHGLTGGLSTFVRRRLADHFCQRGLYSSRELPKPLRRFAVGFPHYLRNSRLDLQLSRESRILDVGSGAGFELINLNAFGFRHLLGIDPFINGDITYPGGPRILKTELSALAEEFDLILANHSLEHVHDVRSNLRHIYRLLRSGHYAIIRMPVVAFAWREFGPDWVQLDPPRHLQIFKATVFSRVAEQTGFAVRAVTYDSTAFQFWGSEQYRNDIPLMDSRSYLVNPEQSLFTAKQISEFAAEAARLNEQGQGDQAVFYLFKTSP